MINDLRSLCRTFSHHIFKLDHDKALQLERFLGLLMEWQAKMNLISRKETEIVHRHFGNSACIAHFFRFSKNDRVLDIGSGGGFPSLVLKILFPDTLFVLVESTTKKTVFLETVIDELQLKKILVVNDRIEKINRTPPFKSKFTVVTARAVARLPELVSWSMPVLASNGKMVFLKGRSVEQELTDLKSGLHQEILPLSDVPGLGDHQEGVLWVSNVGK